jgi:hypothetical protein
MCDTLYLSLWYPNLRLEALPDKLAAVLGAFAAHGGEAKVYAATVWPVSWNEAPVFQRIFGRAGSGPERGAEPRQAVEEALELLHEDYAYEFQIGWSLWEIETDGGASAGVKATAGPSTPRVAQHAPRSAQDDNRDLSAPDDSAERGSTGVDARTTAGLPPRQAESGLAPPLRDPGLETGATQLWVREPRLVRVTGFGPLFDEGAYEQDGHIRVDFGTDTPFLEEDADLDAVGARHVEENVRQLVELTTAVEKASGATARLLWSELGESLAQRLAARLGMRS